MSKIKSALELALERTEGIKADPEAVKREEMKKEGKITAGKLLNGEETDIKTRLKALSKTDRKWFTEGAVESIMSNLVLPYDETDLVKLDTLSGILQEFDVDKKMINGLFQQMKMLFGQYLNTLEQLRENLTAQYEPHLRAKEQKMRQQTGQDYHLTAEQDPDFLKLMHERVSSLQEQYRQVITRAREELKKIL